MIVLRFSCGENELARIASATLADDEFLESLASDEITPSESASARPAVKVSAIILFIQDQRVQLARATER
jgi:hypothetical protein